MSCSSLNTVSEAVRGFINAEKDLGHTISNEQSPESFGRMRAGITEAMSSYAMNNEGDWKKYACWNEVGLLRYSMISESRSRFPLNHLIRSITTFATSLTGRTACLNSWSYVGARINALESTTTPSHIASSHPSGQVKETQYMIEKDEFSGGIKSLINLGSNLLSVGEVGYINDFQCLHSVGGVPASVPAPGSVTLHCYCPPITEVTLYEPADDTSGMASPRGGAVKVSTRKPGFYSVRGTRT